MVYKCLISVVIDLNIYLINYRILVARDILNNIHIISFKNQFVTYIIIIVFQRKYMEPIPTAASRQPAKFC